MAGDTAVLDHYLAPLRRHLEPADLRDRTGLTVDRHLRSRGHSDHLNAPVRLTQRDRGRSDRHHASVVVDQRMRHVFDDHVDLGMRPARREPGHGSQLGRP